METQASVRRPAATSDTTAGPFIGAAFRKVWDTALLPALGMAAVLLTWWLVTATTDIRPLFLPSPESVLEQLRDHPGYYAEHAWITFYQTFLGFTIATLSGLVTAVLLVSSRPLERATLPLVISLHAIPKVALAPLLVVWLSYGAAPKIALAALISFFPIVVATMAGLNSTPADLGELARSLTASRLQTFLKIRAPWALPQVFIGLKLAMTLALIGTVVAQIQNPTGGLGGVISTAGTAANTDVSFAAIAVLLVISLGLFYGIVTLERLLLPWARETTAAART